MKNHQDAIAKKSVTTNPPDIERRKVTKLIGALTLLGMGLGVNFEEAFAGLKKVEKPSVNSWKLENPSVDMGKLEKQSAARDKAGRPSAGHTKIENPSVNSLKLEHLQPERPGVNRAKPIPAKPGVTRAKPVPAAMPKLQQKIGTKNIR